MIKKYRKPLIELREHTAYLRDEIANPDSLSMLLEELIPDGENKNEEWAG